MNKTGQRIWLLITLLFAVGVIAIIFPQILLDPGHVIPGIAGDSGKNMYSYLYHILYDKGYWFTGMNYPYGEHIIYTDGQPLLSVTLSYFRHTTISQALTAMWGFILLSYVLAIIYVYKTLLHFGVKAFVAMLFSGLIIVMSPQLFRMLGHFGLSYVCVVPMLFYWTIKYNNSQQKKYALYIFILGIVATFLHPYFCAVILFWVSFYTIGYFIFTKVPWRSKLRHVFPLLLSIIFLFAITGIVVQFTDPIKDRPVAPYGMLSYCTRGEDIFTSHYSPVWKFLEDHTGFIKNRATEEGFTYLGLTAIIVFVCSFIKWVIRRRKKTYTPDSDDTDKFPPIWLFMAFVFILLGMGVPFVWHMEWLVNYLSFLRQFRTLGRFSWIFYYIITIYAVVTLYKYHAKYLIKGKTSIAYAILVAAFALWSFEASGYITVVRDAINKTSGNYDHLCGKDGHDWRQFLAVNHYNPSKFQAILVLPFFSVGSDKLWMGNEWVLGAGFESAIQMHVPIIDAMMSRSSWGITEIQVKIAGGPYASKPMLKDLPDNEPFLMLNYEQEELDPDQKYLLAAADLIGTFNEWRVYACYPDRIKANDKKHTDSVKGMIPYLKIGDTCIGCSGTWYADHFDSGKSQEKFFGNGALPQIMQFETVIANIPVRANGLYELSCWFLLGTENFKSPYFKLDLLDASGNVIGIVDVLTKESTDNKGLWFRAGKFFTIPPNCSSIRCRLFNDPDNAYKIMDELLLRPADATVISRSASGAIMVNNHLLVQ